MKHARLANLSGGEGMDSWIQPACSCEWTGSQHYAYSSHQFSNATDDFERHVKLSKLDKVQGGGE